MPTDDPAPPTPPTTPTTPAKAAATACGVAGGPAAAERLRCPHCDYDLTGLADAGTCPECGSAITADDRKYQLRRQIFLELTRFSPWWRLGVMVLIGLPFYGWPLIFLLPPLLVAAAWFTGSRARDAAQHRLVRRLWLINLCWLQLPWIVPIIADLVIEIIAWSPVDIFGLGDLWFDDYDHLQFKTLMVFACFGAVLALPVWTWRWRTLARTAGATAASAQPKHIGLRIALRICLWPMFLPILIVVVSWAVIALADRFWPGWG